MPRPDDVGTKREARAMSALPASHPRDRSESPEERMQRRRARRWSRRLRTIGPFFGILLLLATLALSVDLIEYDPLPETQRLTTRPIPEQLRQEGSGLDREAMAPGVSSLSVVGDGEAPRLRTPDLTLGLEDDVAKGSAAEAPPYVTTDGPRLRR